MATKTILKVKRLSKDAVLPVRASKDAAGYDLVSAETLSIPPSSKKLVKTDLSLEIPEGCYGRIAPRSSLALKYIGVGAGVIDRDYRGNVGIIIFNHHIENTFYIRKGDRIAQLILEKIEIAEVEEVTETNETVRGEGGFGSTGTSTLAPHTVVDSTLAPHQIIDSTLAQ